MPPLNWKRRDTILLFLLVATGQAYAQSEYSRWSIRPLLGVGINFPAKQTQSFGQQPLMYTWKMFHFGSVINEEGKRSLSLNATYRAGLQFNYRISDHVEVFGGAERINLIYGYKHRFGFDFKGKYLNGYYDTFSYWNLMSGLRVNTYNLFYSAALQFQPNAFANIDRKGNSSSDFLNQEGTGITFNEVQRTNKRIGLYLGLGQEIEIMNSPGSVEIGVNLAFAPVLKEQIDFYQANNLVASTVLDRTVNSFFITLTQALYFKKRERHDKQSVEELEAAEDEQPMKVGNKVVSVGEHLVLQEIQFQQSEAELTESAISSLQEVLAFMEDYPKAKIEFSGHTSMEGSRRENIKLSEERAEACKNYLVERGVEAKRIRTVGYGPDKPLSDSNQELNRRVEFQVLSVE